MSAAIVAAVPTASASRYLQQLCKHWAHRLPAAFTAGHGTVTLPLGGCELTAGPETLTVRLTPAAPDQADRLKQVVADHLDRFAFREAPLRFEWREEQAPK